MTHKTANNKNGWKYYLKNLATVLFILIIFDLTIGGLLQHFYFKIKSGVSYRTTYAIEKTNADMIVFGSSRAENHYYPSFFEDRLKLSFFNTGRDGEESCIYPYALLKGILKRYSPKIVILDVMYGELGNKLYGYEKLASLTPYYRTHPEMRPIIELRSSYEKLKLTSGIYPFNSLIMNIVAGNLDTKGKGNVDVQGYLPKEPVLNFKNKPIATIDLSEKYELDTIKVNVFRSFIKECLAANIKLYLVCSPYYERHTGTDLSITEIKKMAEENNLRFFDFSQQPFFLADPKYFSNAWHLNDSGAKIFSKMLADSIYISQKSDDVAIKK